MLPILIAAAGALLVLGGGKKKRKKSSGSGTRPDTGEEPGGGEPPGGGGGGASGHAVGGLKAHHVPSKPGGKKLGEPYSYCDLPEGTPKGSMAAVSQDGESCMIFWTSSTPATVVSYLEEELNKLPKEERDALCAADNCEPDQFAMEPEIFCNWIPDPAREAFVKKFVLRLYPQIAPHTLPPPQPDGLGRVNAPHFIKYVWTRVYAIFAHDFCGFNPVT